MANYIIAYHGGKMPDNPEEGVRHREKFTAWIAGLGDAVVNPGTPLGMSKIVSSSGVTDTDESHRLMGFSVVTADSMDAALQIAKGCPFLDMGTLEVAEMLEM